MAENLDSFTKERMLKREEKMRQNIFKFNKEKSISIEQYPSSFLFVRFLYKSEFLKQNNLFFPFYRRFEDPVFLAKALSLQPNMYAITDSVYTYRLSHKVPSHNFDTYTDILKGIEDCLNIYLRNKMFEHVKDIMRELDSRENHYKRYVKDLESIEIIQLRIDKLKHKFKFYSSLSKINERFM